MTSKEPKKHVGVSDSMLDAFRHTGAVVGGKGVEIALVTDGEVTHYFNNKLPTLKIDTLNAEREIEVEVSSVEAENDHLLHYLYRRAVESE